MTDDLLTPEQLAEIERRAEAATEGPWRNENQVVADENSIVIGDETYNWRFVAHANSDAEPDAGATPVITEADAKANAEFIAHARTDIPALLAHARALQAERDEWKQMHDKLAAQWSSWSSYGERKVEAFRRAAIEAVRARCDGRAKHITAAWIQTTMYAKCKEDEAIIELLQQLPATGTEEVGRES